MKKSLKYVFLIGGFLLIIFGSITLLSNKGKVEDYSNKIKVNTSSISGDKIDNSKYDVYTTNDFLNTFIKSYDTNKKNKYNFSYPKQLKEKSLNESSRTLIDNKMIVTASLLLSDDYKNYFDNLISMYKENNKIKSFVSEDLTISNFSTKYAKFELLNDTIYRELFIILIREKDDDFVAITYMFNNLKVTDDFLTELINKVTIEKENANYLYTHTEGEYLTGTLEQLDLDGKKFSLTFKMPDPKYREIELGSNSLKNTTLLSTQKKDLMIEVELSQNNNSLNDYIDNIKNKYDYEGIVEYKNFDSNTVTYNDKEFLQTSFDYTDYRMSEKNNRYYLSLIYEVSNGLNYIVTFTSSEKIEQDTIDDFVNFSIES